MRTLDDAEIDQLLSADLVARLATIDAAGCPHVTPVWFLRADDVFYVSSYMDRPHLARVKSNPRVGLVIDTEQAQRGDGERRTAKFGLSVTPWSRLTQRASGRDGYAANTSMRL